MWKKLFHFGWIATAYCVNNFCLFLYKVEFFNFISDESPTTCSVFLEEAGMELFLRVLEIFQGESAVETKVLGLINNIAEVSHLRNRLMKPEFIFILR